MPDVLAFGQAVTVPVVWITTHYCVVQAQLKAMHEAVSAQRERQLNDLVELEKERSRAEMAQAQALAADATPTTVRLVSAGAQAARRPEGAGAWGLALGPERAARAWRDATGIRHAHAEQPAPVRPRRLWRRRRRHPGAEECLLPPNPW